MRYLIVSDIHANLEAFEAVLEAAPAYDSIWNLGDVVGYGAAPNEVIDRVTGLGQIFVRGNHDRVCCGLESAEDFNPIAQRAARWTQRTLTPGHIDWLRNMLKGPIMPDGPSVSCVHGSLLDEDDYVTTVREAIEPLALAQTRITFFGHTHVQGGFATNGEHWFDLHPDYGTRDHVDFTELELRDTARYLINPGSVGQPRDRDWRAAFAVYDDTLMTVTFGRTPYDLRRAQERILDAGLPDRLASRLKDGR